MTARRVLTLILLSYLVLGVIYAIKTPVFEASDELWHYPMVRHLADGNPLPVQVFDPAQAGPWKQEASQPPLYYYLGAALTFWIDTGDMPEVRRLNPHVDNGVLTVDGNTNLVIHDPALSPWQGTLLAVRIVRLASVLMGLVTVTFTYGIACALWPGKESVALGAAALNAFTPMFLFISGAVNNDNLAIMLASWALYVMVRLVKYPVHSGTTGAWTTRWLGLGLLIGLAALTKEGALGLVPIALGTAAIVSWQQASKDLHLTSGEAPDRFWRCLLGPTVRGALARFALTLLPILVVAGWWYYRNLVLYGDLLGWNAFIAVLGERPQPATLTQLWGERWGFLASYWGLFGGVNVPMPGWIYSILNGLLLLAVPGFLFYLGKSVSNWRVSVDGLASALPEARIGRWVALIFDFVAARFALVASIVFSAAVVYGLINWATTTWSSQGRLAFTAIATLSSLFALGLFGWLPEKPARMFSALVGVFMLAIAAAAPFLWIAPAYAPQQADPPVPLETVDISFGEQMKLDGYAIRSAGEDGVVQPGAAVDVYLRWRVLSSMTRDWSVFVHLNDPVLQTPLAQRDMYLGGGLLPTTLLSPGETRIEHYRIDVPPTAAAPADLELVVGLYDYQTEERLMSEHGDAVVVEELRLEMPSDEAARQLEINFGNELALVGHELAVRRLGPGQTLELTLTWSALQSMTNDYTFFAQVLNERDTTRWAASDLETPTSQWSAGSEHSVSMPMTVRDDTPPGVYVIIVGAYTRGEGGSFDRLQIVRDGRITMDDALQLTRIRIE